MILVDTSVWVDHLRRDNRRLRELLEDGAVLSHPFVVGELACGSIRNRDEILGHLSTLPQALVAEHQEVLRLTQAEKLFGKGLGWMDVHLLASARLSSVDLWTLNKRLSRAALFLGISA
jgi:predicted nucleic acid-binding protein